MIYINILKSYFSFIIIFSIIIIVFFYPILSSDALTTSNISSNSDFEHIDSSLKISKSINGSFIWPVPGNTKISSPFGKRNAPTSGASSFHYGTDIPAPEGTKLIAIADGQITFCSFLGAGGYTIILSFDNFKVSYCHVSPNFIVSVGDFVKQGQVIGCVGPKYVYGVPGNPYSDSSGKPTNRCYYAVVIFIYGFRIDGEYKNPLNYF